MNADKIIWHTSLIVQHFSYHSENKSKKKHLSGKHVNLQHVFLIIPIFNKQILFFKKKKKEQKHASGWKMGIFSVRGSRALDF